MPSADFRDYAEIPLFRQDAICILIGFSRWYCLGNAGALESLLFICLHKTLNIFPS
jgi:hypothetical protein